MLNDVRIISKYAFNLITGAQFLMASASWASVHGDWVLVHYRTFARIAQAVAGFAGEGPEAAMIAGPILRDITKAQYTTNHELIAKMYRTAGETVARGYEDIVGKAGPEGPAFAGSRPYPLATVVRLMAVLSEAAEPGRGQGWVLARLVAGWVPCPKCGDDLAAHTSTDDQCTVYPVSR